MQSRTEEERNRLGEQLVVCHRNPLARDYVVVSRVVLIGYAHLSDGAKLTYWVIYSHDWYETERGGRKGYAYPTVCRLAHLRHTTPRTIQRHLAELIEVGLLTRLIRRGKPSLLYIEEPSQAEMDAYLQQRQAGGDNSVRGGVTKMSPQQKEESKQIKCVNGIENTSMEERRRNRKDWTPMSMILKTRGLSGGTHNRVGWLAEQILAATGDTHSLGCYRAIAGRCPQALVFEALALLKEAKQDGTIRRSRGALFVGIIRRLCRERGLPDPLGTVEQAPAQLMEPIGYTR